MLVPLLSTTPAMSLLVSLPRLLILLAASTGVWASESPHQHHGGHQAAAPDKRAWVKYPKPLIEHTLANMRDHLAALQDITNQLAAGRYGQAADIAEQRLGMSSLQTHGAHEVAKYMPEGMKAVGSAMHSSASEFAVAAQNAGATGDLKPALAAMAKLQGQCVACHAAYRLR
jgi:hypothetical protein